MKTLGILLVLVLLSGCTGGATPPPDDTQAAGEAPGEATASADPTSVLDALPTSAEPVWSTPIKALQPPVPAGDVLVMVAAVRGDELDVVALDRATGQVRWRRPMMAVDSQVGAFLGDLVHESSAGETYVVFQQALTGAALQPGLARPYLAVEPSTGRVVARTRPVVAKFGAPTCEDGVDVCLRISEETFDETRWDLDSWQLRPEKDRFPVGTNPLVAGSDVYTVYGPVDGYGVARAMGRAGPDGWRVGHRRITGSKDWLLRDEGGLVDETAGVAVVALAPTTPGGLVRRYEAGQTVRVDLSRRRTAGVAVADGRVLWRHGGADFGCLELARQDLPVRCALEGDLVVRESWDESRIDEARAFLEGYDLETGDTTWRHELDRRATKILALRLDEMDIAIDRIADADDLAVVPTRDGAALVSLVDGSSRPLVAGGGEEDTVLCTREIGWQHRFDTSGTSGGVGFGDERTRFVRVPCDSRGDARPGASPGVPGIVTGGVDAGDGIWSWATGDTVEAHRLS